MSRGIRVSEKHGVNPTIPICAWCGEQKNEIALLGKLPGDVEAPKNLLLDYEPCDKCKEEWDKGVAIIEVSRTPKAEGQPPIGKDAYPTGRLVVVNEESLKGNYKAGDKALAREEDFTAMFPDF